MLRFHFKWSDYEIKQSKHMQETFRSIIHEMGGTPLSRDADRGDRTTISRPAGGSSTRSASSGWATTRSTSALNKNCQAHDAKNVFVADGGPFVSQADKNCTWTILALAMRTAHYIADERKRGARS